MRRREFIMWPPRFMTYLISNPDGEFIRRCLSYLHGLGPLLAGRRSPGQSRRVPHHGLGGYSVKNL
jgi:hypothetical protein